MSQPTGHVAINVLSVFLSTPLRVVVLRILIRLRFNQVPVRRHNIVFDLGPEDVFIKRRELFGLLWRCFGAPTCLSDRGMGCALAPDLRWSSYGIPDGFWGCKGSSAAPV